MLKNCVNKLSCKTQTAMQDSATENCSRTNTRLMMLATHRITDCTQLPQQTKKTSQQNRFVLYQRSVTICDDVSWQVKIGLHQFDSNLSQVKSKVTTVYNSCFLPDSRSLASSSSFSRTVPRRTERLRQSTFLSVPGNLAKC